jgi:hypothetical protein
MHFSTLISCEEAATNIPSPPARLPTCPGNLTPPFHKAEKKEHDCDASKGKNCFS